MKTFLDFVAEHYVITIVLIILFFEGIKGIIEAIKG